MINRRAFLTAIIGGATLSSALIASKADAATFNEYKKLIDLQEKVILLTDKYFGGVPLGERENSFDCANPFSKPIFTASDELINYMTKEFDPTPDYTKETREIVLRMFEEGVHFDTLSEDDLRQQEKPVVSIAIIRTLLHKHRVPMQPRYMTGFVLFAERYKYFIA